MPVAALSAAVLLACGIAAAATGPEAKPDASPATRPAGPGGRVPEPIELQVLKHERALFGWEPAFVLNVPCFDRHNRPVIRSRTADRNRTRFLHVLTGAGWEEREFVSALRKAVPDFRHTLHGAGHAQPTRVVFDADNWAYTMVTVAAGREDGKARTINVLLWTADLGRSWQAVALPKRGAFSMEYHAGHNELAGPPAFVLCEPTGPRVARWATRSTLWLFLPRKADGGLAVGEPVKVTDRAFGISLHSGGASVLATRDGKTHITWAEVTDKGKARGAPTCVATFDRATGRLGPRVLLGQTSAPPNDVHNTPGLVMDRAGRLHVVLGSHGREFYYTSSVRPNRTTGGWTKFAPTAAGARQTYVGLLCGPDDTLHLFYRQWRRDKNRHGGRQYAALSYQRKPPGKPWSPPRPLVVAPLPAYSIYYHQPSLDRTGRLYLSYSYWRQTEPYKSIQDKQGPYQWRAMLCSEDAGHTWHLATTKDFREGMKTAARANEAR